MKSIQTAQQELNKLKNDVIGVFKYFGGFNIVNCENCGSILLHECNEEDNIDCPYCDKLMSKSDCPDFLYDGLELSAEFVQEIKN